MDSMQFDSLARALATGVSRRGALRVLAGGVAGAGLVAAFGGRGAVAANDKVLICHLTGSETNPVVVIEVSVDAIPAHEAHGDSIVSPDFDADPNNCGGCFVSCDDGDPCTVDDCVEGVCVNTPIDDGECGPPCLEFGTCCPDEATCLARCCLGFVGQGNQFPCESGFFCNDDDGLD